MAAFAQNVALNIPNSVLKKWMKTKVWETARDAGQLDKAIVRSLLDGYSAAVDWPANYWYRWLRFFLAVQDSSICDLVTE